MCNEMNEEIKQDSVDGTPKNEDGCEKDELALLTEENEKIIKELDEYKDKYLRLMAEYDNFRKRSAKEKTEIYPEATAKAIEAFLPLADNFERAIAAETSDEKYKNGVMMIYNQLGDVFKSLGVEVINRVGEEFDPNLENAVARVQNEELGENVVSEVYQKGYKRGDKVIRHAMVAVANCD